MYDNICIRTCHLYILANILFINRLDFNGYYTDKMLHFSLKTNQTDDDDTISG